MVSVCCAGARFLKVPITFRNQKAVQCLQCFTFKIKVSIILKMIQWNYSWLTKPNWLVYDQGTVLLFKRFWFKDLRSGSKSYRDLREAGPWRPLATPSLSIVVHFRTSLMLGRFRYFTLVVFVLSLLIHRTVRNKMATGTFTHSS